MADPTRAGGKDPFEYQKPSPEQVERIELIRQQCRQLNGALQVYVKPSRERSLAMTKLEEAGMWAVRAISQEDVALGAK